jgi:protein-tyrosine phosphatase
MNKIEVLFVCMGNICRSPTAEAVFRYYVAAAGLSQRIVVDSAGTHAYHIGNPPDARSQRHAERRGFDLSALRARQVVSDDYVRFDYVLAMDADNFALLARDCPPAHAAKLALFMRYGERGEAISVPDPYYGGTQGFERVLDMVEDAAQGLLRHIRERHAL